MMKALLLAAGFGTRLKPLTNKLPKPLIAVNSIPLILYNLALLKKYGIDEVVINLHYQGELIQEFLGSGSDWGIHLQYSWEKNILGTGGGIKKASHLLDQKPFLVLNSDIIMDVDIEKIISKAKGSLATLVVQKLKKPNEYKPVYVDSQGFLLSFGQKSTIKEKIIEATFVGMHVIDPQLIDKVDENKPSCIIRDVYTPYLEQGGKIKTYLSDGFWNELGSLDRLQKMKSFVKNNPNWLSYHPILKEYQKTINQNPLKKRLISIDF